MSDYRHFPAFEELCDCAESHRLQVRLAASTDRVSIGLRKGEEYRRLMRVELWKSHLPGVSGVQRYGGRPVAATPIIDDDLEAAAYDLLGRVA